MHLQVPEPALRFGFVNDPPGPHGSRTMMLTELRMLLAACPRPATYEQFRTAVVDDNTLLKKTLSTREKSFRFLRELYSLDINVVLFRALRDLWEDDPIGQPLIALLCAVGRDPILRATSEFILALAPGDPAAPEMLEGEIRRQIPGRYGDTLLASASRNTASSWEQSGHLKGYRNKERSRAKATPAAAAYALLLAHLCGNRGETMFNTLWVRLLDAPKHRLQELASEASRLGWLEYRRAGDVTDISFDYLLRDYGQSEPLL